MYCCHLRFQRLIHSWIRLYDHFSSHALSITVFLLGKSGQGNNSVQFFLFFGGYPETDRNTTEAILPVYIFADIKSNSFSNVI